MILRPEEVERALLNCMSSNRQILFALHHNDIRAAMVSIIYAREKIGTWCVHRVGHEDGGIVTSLFFQSLCEALIRPA